MTADSGADPVEVHGCTDVHPIILGRKKSATIHIHIGILVSGSDCIYLRPNKMNSFSGLDEGHEASKRWKVIDLKSLW